MRGAGFSFQAPATWTVAGKGDSVAASSGPVDLLQARRFALEKAYRPALFVAASKELDRDASELAAQKQGHVADRVTKQIAGRKTRYYRIVYGSGRTEEIAFVLDRRNEFQLLCRRSSTSSDADCARLFTSFALG